MTNTTTPTSLSPPASRLAVKRESVSLPRATLVTKGTKPCTDTSFARGMPRGGRQ
jgi:hypothetical protein